MKRRFTQAQKDALAYTSRFDHPALFMQQRLGKSPVTIKTIQSYRRTRRSKLRVLIVAPSGALDDWEVELETLGERDVSWLMGPRPRRLMRLQEGHEWNLLNKEGWRVLPEIAGMTRCTVCRGKGKKHGSLCQACRGKKIVPSDDDPEWDAVVWDESFWIKNPKPAVTKFFLKFFRDVPHRFALTGTPNPESDLDFWTQLAWLDGEAFGCGSYYQFRARYFKPSWSGHKFVIRDQKRAVRLQLQLHQRAFIIDRKTAGMYDEKIKQRRVLDLPPKMRKIYKTAQDEFILLAKNGKIKAKTLFAGARWHWLRRIASGRVEKQLLWKGKFNELKDLVCGEFAKEPIVVWFSYRWELYHAKKILKAAGVSCNAVSGKTKRKERSRRKKAFRAGKLRVLLVMDTAECAGANFSAADVAIYFHNNPAYLVRSQSEDRLLHLTKKRPILLIDLVTRGTVDEEVRELLIEKSWRSQTMLNRAMRLRFANKGV